MLLHLDATARTIQVELDTLTTTISKLTSTVKEQEDLERVHDEGQPKGNFMERSFSVHDNRRPTLHKLERTSSTYNS